MTEETEGSQMSVMSRVNAAACVGLSTYVLGVVESQGGAVYCFNILVLLCGSGMKRQRNSD